MVTTDRGWEVEVVPLVAGQRSVKEKEWLESFKVFGIGKDDGKKIMQRLGCVNLRPDLRLLTGGGFIYLLVVQKDHKVTRDPEKENL